MILVAFFRVMPGVTLLRITTTRGIVFSQSLCKMTFQGRSGLALLRVRVPSALLICVVVICGEPFCHRPVPRTPLYLFPLARKLTP
jgi:hypothetical protein